MVTQQFNNQLPPRSQFSYFGGTSATATNNIVWVQGIEGAKAWQLNPNSMIILLDSEVEGKMYIKVSDNIGMCSLRVFNYVEEIPSSTNETINDLDLSKFVKREELIDLIKEIIKNEQLIPTVSATPADTTTTTAAQPKITFPKK